MMEKTQIKIGIVFLLALALHAGFAMAAASFQVTSFSCSPSEVVINNLFSCTATIQNTGDAAGTLSTATLYPDSGNWLEDSNYPQSYGQSVNPGNSVQVTFSGLRATESGDNGFSKIMLDSVTDTYVADNNKKVNVINVAVTISNSASSAAMGGTVTTTAEVTAGGNIDVSLSFTSNSGGCSIGSQTNPRSISGMTDGSKQSRTWTITQGTTGSCSFTISAAATGSGGVASKIDSTTDTITCTDCPVSSSSSSSSSSGGGAGGAGGGAAGAGVRTYVVGELVNSQMVILLSGEKISLNLSRNNYLLTLISRTNTSVLLGVDGDGQRFTINLDGEVEIDLNSDTEKDLSVKLNSIDTITGEVSLVLARMSGANNIIGLSPEDDSGEVPASQIDKEIMKSKIAYILLAVFGAIAIVSAVIYVIERNKRKRRWGER